MWSDTHVWSVTIWILPAWCAHWIAVHVEQKKTQQNHPPTCSSWLDSLARPRLLTYHFRILELCHQSLEDVSVTTESHFLHSFAGTTEPALLDDAWPIGTSSSTSTYAARDLSMFFLITSTSSCSPAVLRLCPFDMLNTHCPRSLPIDSCRVKAIQKSFSTRFEFATACVFFSIAPCFSRLHPSHRCPRSGRPPVCGQFSGPSPGVSSSGSNSYCCLPMSSSLSTTSILASLWSTFLWSSNSRPSSRLDDVLRSNLRDPSFFEYILFILSRGPYQFRRGLCKTDVLVFESMSPWCSATICSSVSNCTVWIGILWMDERKREGDTDDTGNAPTGRHALPHSVHPTTQPPHDLRRAVSPKRLRRQTFQAPLSSPGFRDSKQLFRLHIPHRGQGTRWPLNANRIHHHIFHGRQRDRHSHVPIGHWISSWNSSSKRKREGELLHATPPESRWRRSDNKGSPTSHVSDQVVTSVTLDSLSIQRHLA